MGFFLGEGPGGGVVAASDGGDVVVVGGRVIACRFDALLLAESRLGFGCSWEEVGFAHRLESVMPVSESWSQSPGISLDGDGRLSTVLPLHRRPAFPP